MGAAAGGDWDHAHPHWAHGGVKIYYFFHRACLVSALHAVAGLLCLAAMMWQRVMTRPPCAMTQPGTLYRLYEVHKYEYVAGKKGDHPSTP